VQWPAGLNLLHNPGAERLTGANTTTHRSRAPAVRSIEMIPAPGANAVVGWLFGRQLGSEPPVQFERQPKPRIRRPQQPRSGGVIVRAVPHIDVEICTVVAVLHVWQ
jgi:hypothetical protein